jgi:hypothetical protein
MDATPVTLGQEFGGYAAQVATASSAPQAALPRLGELPLGGTAVGTGINTPPGSPRKVIARSRVDTGLPLHGGRDHFEAQARATRWSRRGQLRTSRSASTRSPTTCAGWARPARRPRRDPPARPAAGLVDHAGQGQPGDPRGVTARSSRR